MSNLLFLDLETTGLDTDICEVIEVAYKTNDSEDWSSLYKPNIPIPPDVSGITNIDNIDVDHLETFGRSDQYFDLYYKASDHIAVTHNTDFDLAVLANHDINFEKSICTHKLAWALLPELANHKLGTLRAYFGIPHGNGTAHRAEYDVEILTKVYAELCKLATVGKTYSNESEAVADMIEISNQAKLDYLNTWHFGKYKGEKIDSYQHETYIIWNIEKNKSLSKNFRVHLLELIQYYYIK